jgi:hypothetical protein
VNNFTAFASVFDNFLPYILNSSTLPYQLVSPAQLDLPMKLLVNVWVQSLEFGDPLQLSVVDEAAPSCQMYAVLLSTATQT